MSNKHVYGRVVQEDEMEAPAAFTQSRELMDMQKFEQMLMVRQQDIVERRTTFNQMIALSTEATKSMVHDFLEQTNGQVPLRIKTIYRYIDED